MADSAPELPPPSFEMLVQLLSSQALLGLGLIPGPNGKVEKQLTVSRHFIELLSILFDKTQGHLTDAESKMLAGNLHELRMAFVEASKTP